MHKETITEILEDIQMAKLHLRNAENWLRAAKAGKTPDTYHYTEAMEEAGSYIASSLLVEPAYASWEEKVKA